MNNNSTKQTIEDLRTLTKEMEKMTNTSIAKSLYLKIKNRLEAKKELQEAIHYVKELAEIVETHEPNKEIKQDVREKLNDLKQLLKLDYSKKKHLSAKEINLLKNYLTLVPPSEEFKEIVKIVREVNKQYNPKDTNKTKRIDLRAKSLELSHKNNQELVKSNKLLFRMADRVLETLMETPDKLPMESFKLWQEVIDSRQKLVQEKEALMEMMKKATPDDYSEIAGLIEEKLSLYTEQGRADLVDVEEMTSKVNKIFEGANTKHKLEELAASSQALRRKENPMISKDTRSEPSIGDK